MAKIKINQQLISIITPTYNNFSRLKKTIKSFVKASRFLKIEVIIIDDCSTDETFEFCKSLCHDDLVLRYHRNNTNLGVSASRNIGINISNGTYLTFVDSDDFFHVNKINSDFDDICFDESCDIIFFPVVNEARRNDSYFESIKTPELINNNEQLIEKLIEIDFHFMECFGVLIRKDALINNQIFFPENMCMSEDTIFMWELISQTNSFSYIDQLEYLHVATLGGLATSFMHDNVYALLEAIIRLKKYYEIAVITHQKYLIRNLQRLFEELFSYLLIFKNQLLANRKHDLETIFDWGRAQNILCYKSVAIGNSRLTNYLNDLESDILSKGSFSENPDKSKLFLYCLSSKSIAVASVFKRNSIHVDGIIDDNRKSEHDAYSNDIRVFTFDQVSTELKDLEHPNLDWFLICHGNKAVFQSIRSNLLAAEIPDEQIFWVN